MCLDVARVTLLATFSTALIHVYIDCLRDYAIGTRAMGA